MATIDEVRSAQPGTLKIIDIRKKPDGRQIPGSTRLNGDELEAAQDVPFGKEERVVLYCGSGNSCSRIAASLRERGYRNTEALEGGYAAWKDAGLPLDPLDD